MHVAVAGDDVVAVVVVAGIDSRAGGGGCCGSIGGATTALSIIARRILQRHIQPATPTFQVMLKANSRAVSEVPKQIIQMMSFEHLQLLCVDCLL